MQIAKNAAVTFHYTLTDDDGQVVDSSAGREPLAYLHGQGQIVPGLEKQMEGRQVGDKFDAHVAPEEGYGVRHEELATHPKALEVITHRLAQPEGTWKPYEATRRLLS